MSATQARPARSSVRSAGALPTGLVAIAVERVVAGRPRTVLVALVALTLLAIDYVLRAQQSLTGNLWGVPVDDAYIHFRFAQNLAAGHGFSFNPGHPVAGSTSPLWTLILALPSLAGVPIWLAAKAIGVAGLVVSALLAWRLAHRCSDEPLTALAAGALTAVDGRLLWAAPSGMEITLFTAFSLGAFLARPEADAQPATRDRRMLVLALLCGFASLLRPEGYLLTAILFADSLLRCRPSIKAWVVSGGLYVAMLLPYALFALATTGHPLPTTFYAKADPAFMLRDPVRILAYLLAVATFLYNTNPLILILAPFGLVSMFMARGEARAVVAWPLLLLIEQALMSPNGIYHYARYVMPLDPFFAIWAVVGVSWLHRRVGWRETRHISFGIHLAVSLVLLPRWAAAYADSVHDINTMQVTMAHWVRAHVPQDQPVAVNDIGAIGFVADHPVIDLVGLVSPEFLSIEREQPAQRDRDLYAAIRRTTAQYLIIFPAWYSNLAARPDLRPIYSITISGSYIEGAPTMVVYQLPHS